MKCIMFHQEEQLGNNNPVMTLLLSLYLYKFPFDL